MGVYAKINCLCLNFRTKGVILEHHQNHDKMLIYFTLEEKNE